MEATLGEFNKQVMLGKEVKHIMYCHDMIVDGRTCADDDIIHVDLDYCTLQSMLVNEGTEDMIHHSLKHCWGVSEPKVHDHGFPDAKAGFECCCPLVPIMDMDVVISPPDIKSGKDE